MTQPIAPGVLHLVATPIGNLEDLSPRAARLICGCDRLYAEDTRSARVLWQHARAQVAGAAASAPEIIALFEGNEMARSTQVIADLAAGKRVAYVSEAGMPAISDPGERLVKAVTTAGFDVVVVPGPSAGLAALAASGLPSERFLFLGFLPREHGPRQQALAQLAHERATLVVFESPERVLATLQDMLAAWGPRQACVSREISKLFEQHQRGPLDELLARLEATPPRGECVVVVRGADAEPAVVEDVETMVRGLLAEGFGPKDVAARLVVKTGQPRRALYQLALALAREAEKGT